MDFAKESTKMDELIKLVSQKTGLPQDKAKVAVETVINFLKQKLPPSIAGQLDTLIAGGSLPDNLNKGLGGLLGGKK
jgi:uncharacterized protein (DUF2267 family)